MVTAKRTRPQPDEVRCPQCSAIDWRRLGERVAVATSAAGTPTLEHRFVDDGHEWNWTCQACGYDVAPTDRLDRALTRVQQPRVPALLAPLLGGAGADAKWKSPNLGTLAIGSAVAAAVLVAAIGIRSAGERQPPSPTTMRVTTIAALAAPSDGIAGARVELDGIEVTDVTGDLTFWIAGEDPVLVVLDEERQPEREVTVRPGSVVDIVGTAVAGPPSVDLSDADEQRLGDGDVHIAAESVEVRDP